MPISLQSHAKINLALDVLNRRPDGFHNIHTVFYEISLCDELSFDILPNETGVRLEVVEGDAPGGDDNLIVTAAKWLISQSGSWDGISVKLKKRIPMQAGLGGGSSNAAAAIKAVSSLLNYQGEIVPLAACLGSDVTFFLQGGAASGTGRGNVIRKIETDIALDILVVKPEAGVPTGSAYGELDKSGKAGKSGYSARVIEALAANDREALISSLGNDFELVVLDLFPETASLKKRLLDAGAEAALLSGSGASVFGVFPDAEAAVQAQACFSDVWSAVCRGLPGGGG